MEENARGEGTGVSVTQAERALLDTRITAFEMKLHDWRGGLSQAFRYTYFADAAVLVLPCPKLEKTSPANNLFDSIRPRA